MSPNLTYDESCLVKLILFKTGKRNIKAKCSTGQRGVSKRETKRNSSFIQQASGKFAIHFMRSYF